MSLLDALGAFIGGGGFATAIGTAVGAIAKFKEKKLDQQHELAMLPHKREQWRFEIEISREQHRHEAGQAERALLIESERGANDLLESAINADAREGTAALMMRDQRWWVGAIKTLFRPFLTLVLWTLVFVLWWRSAPGSNVEFVVVNTVVQGAAASLGLWFGSRLVNAPRQH